jgi:hypothetical protein
MKTIHLVAGFLALAMAAPAFAAAPAAAPTKAQQTKIERSLNRRFSDGGPLNVSWHTSGVVKYKGQSVKLGGKTVGFTGDSFQGPGGGDITFKGFANFSGKRMKMTITTQGGP